MQENRWHNAWESWSASWSILFHNFHFMSHSPYVFLFPDFFIFKHFARPLSIKIRRTLLVTCNVALSNFGFWYKTKTQTSLTTLVKYDQKWALVAHLNKVAI